MVLGSLAAGGALGNLIPPGITFIIYGLITETSVGALYIAAVVPSLLVCRAVLRRDPDPWPAHAEQETPPPATAQERWRASST